MGIYFPLTNLPETDELPDHRVSRRLILVSVGFFVLTIVPYQLEWGGTPGQVCILAGWLLAILGVVYSNVLYGRERVSYEIRCKLLGVKPPWWYYNDRMYDRR